MTKILHKTPQFGSIPYPIHNWSEGQYDQVPSIEIRQDGDMWLYGDAWLQGGEAEPVGDAGDDWAAGDWAWVIDTDDPPKVPVVKQVENYIYDVTGYRHSAREMAQELASMGLLAKDA